VEPVVCLMVVELSIFNFQLSTSSSHFQLLTCSFSLPGWKLTLEVGVEVGCVKGFSIFHSLCLTLFNFKYQIAPQYHLLDDPTIGCPPATSNFHLPTSNFQLCASSFQLPALTASYVSPTSQDHLSHTFSGSQLPFAILGAPQC
jgi:hypothetical protein